MPQKADLPKLNPELRRFVEDYVTRAQAIPHVQRIFLAEGDEGYRLWTVIDAPPWEPGPQWAVYEVEKQVLRAHQESLDFRLINLNEYEEPDTVIPLDAVEFFHRGA